MPDTCSGFHFRPFMRKKLELQNPTHPTRSNDQYGIRVGLYKKSDRPLIFFAGDADSTADHSLESSCCQECLVNVAGGC